METFEEEINEIYYSGQHDLAIERALGADEIPLAAKYARMSNQHGKARELFKQALADFENGTNIWDPETMIDVAIGAGDHEKALEFYDQVFNEHIQRSRWGKLVDLAGKASDESAIEILLKNDKHWAACLCDHLGFFDRALNIFLDDVGNQVHHQGYFIAISYAKEKVPARFDEARTVYLSHLIEIESYLLAGDIAREIGLDNKASGLYELGLRISKLKRDYADAASCAINLGRIEEAKQIIVDGFDILIKEINVRGISILWHHNPIPKVLSEQAKNEYRNELERYILKKCDEQPAIDIVDSMLERARNALTQKPPRHKLKNMVYNELHPPKFDSDGNPFWHQQTS